MAKHRGTINIRRPTYTTPLWLVQAPESNYKKILEEGATQQAREEIAAVAFGPDEVHWWWVVFYSPVHKEMPFLLVKQNQIKFPNAWDTSGYPFGQVVMFPPGYGDRHPYQLREIKWRNVDDM